MPARCGCAVTVVLIGLASAGCQRARIASSEQAAALPALGAMRVGQLARLLALEVAESAATQATLRDSANTVVIFAEPGGQAYVNGRAVSAGGRIVTIGGMLFVPQALAASIRAAMRAVAEPARRAVEPDRPLARRRVVIDPGHGGKDPGAISRLGLSEKTVNLSVAREVARLLRQRGLDVTMTRERDVFVELDERADLCNARDADLFISIHADAARNRRARGFTVYVARSASGRSVSAGRAIVWAMTETGLANRGVRRANFRVLVRTRCPAVLVELGYLSNRHDARLLADWPFRKRLAQAVARGVCDFLDVM